MFEITNRVSRKDFPALHIHGKEFVLSPHFPFHQNNSPNLLLAFGSMSVSLLVSLCLNSDLILT